MNLPVLVVARETDKRRDVEAYRLGPSHLATLSICYVGKVRIRASVERSVARSTYSNKPLTEVVAGLCELGGVEFAMDARAARGVDVTCDLHNRTIRECLEVATMVAGWRVRYLVSGKEKATPPSIDFSVGEVATVWHEQLEAARVGGGAEPSALATMKSSVLETVRYIREQKLVVLVEPADRAPVPAPGGRDDDDR